MHVHKQIASPQASKSSLIAHQSKRDSISLNIFPRTHTRNRPITAMILLSMMQSVCVKGAEWKDGVNSVNAAQCRSSLPEMHVSDRRSACLSCHSDMTKPEKELFDAPGFAGLHVDIIVCEATTWVSDTCAACRVRAGFLSSQPVVLSETVDEAQVSRIVKTNPPRVVRLLSASMGRPIAGPPKSQDLVSISFWFLVFAGMHCLRRQGKLSFSRRRSLAKSRPQSCILKRPTRFFHMFVLLALVATVALLLPRANAVSASVLAAQATLDAANIANTALESSIQAEKAARDSATLVCVLLYICTIIINIYTSIYIYTPLYIYSHIYMQYTHLYIYTHIYTCMHTYIHTNVYA